MTGLKALNEQEKALMGRKAIALRDINYGNHVVAKGALGEIVDFGRTSGDPCFKWGNGFAGFAEWHYVQLVEVSL